MSAAKHNGLAAYRARQAEEKQRRLAELESYREHATTVERDGREFTLVRIPDKYDFERSVEPRSETQYHRHSVQITNELARGTGPLFPSGGSLP